MQSLEKLKKNIQKNFYVILAFLIPLILIISVALNIYFSALSVNSSHEFIYTSCMKKNTDCDNSYRENYKENFYSVSNKKIIKNFEEGQVVDEKEIEKRDIPNLFIYNPENNSSREVLFEEIENLKIREQITSPEGVILLYDFDRNPGGFLLFEGGGYDYEFFLAKENKKRKINLISNGTRWEKPIHFIGWIEN